MHTKGYTVENQLEQSTSFRHDPRKPFLLVRYIESHGMIEARLIRRFATGYQAREALRRRVRQP